MDVIDSIQQQIADFERDYEEHRQHQLQRNSKEGHYILDSEDELHDVYDKKLYSGLGKNTIETSNFIPVKSA